MNFADWFALFIKQLKSTGILEWVTVVTGVAEVLLAKKNKVWLYPMGIVSVVTATFLLVESKLYAESVLNMYYLVMSIYGWAVWKSKAASGAREISKSNHNEVVITFAIAVLGWGLLYVVLAKFTDSDVPIMDAFVSSTAWAGMWLLARRKIENWIWLNISNLVAVPLLVHKQLPMFALLTVFLFVVAIFGYFDWRKILEKRLSLQTLKQ